MKQNNLSPDLQLQVRAYTKGTVPFVFGLYTKGTVPFVLHHRNAKIT